MEIIEALDIIGLKDAIKKSFSSVIGELSLASEAWFQKTKLLTVGRQNYADYIATRVGIFPLFAANRSASVETSYVRVDVSTNVESERYRSRFEIQEQLKYHRQGLDADKKRRFVGCTPLAALESTSEGFALIGLPGSGKTTIFRSIAVQTARGIPIKGKKRIPLYLAVRDLSPDQGIIKGAEALFSHIEINEAALVIKALMESGNCIILLDGLDETSNEHRGLLLIELLDIKTKYKSCLYCISARPSGLSMGLAGFTRWETLPLTYQERLLFVQKWFSLVDTHKGERLIKQCKDRPELLDLGSNPLLLSIVCALFHNDLDIPSEADELYERALNGLLGGWDAFRNIARSSILAEMPIKKRLIIVSWLAASLFEERKIVFSPADVNATGCLQQATKALRRPPIDADDLLPALYNDFGILVERSPKLYSFSHLTIHEYLVAKYIVDNRREMAALTAHRSDREWEEIIRLVAKMLPNADEFMTHLQKKTKLEDMNEVRLLESAWLSKPICSARVIKELMTQIGKTVDSITTRFADFEIVRSGSSIVLIANIPVSVEPKGEYAKERKTRFFSPTLVTQCLPSLLRIMKASDITYEEIGIHHSRLFKKLIQARVFEIDRVEIQDTQTAKDIEPTGSSRE